MKPASLYIPISAISCTLTASAARAAKGVRVADLIVKYGADYCLNKIIAKLRCSRCGGKDVNVTFSWDLEAAAERWE